MQLNECEFINILTTCCNGKKCSAEELSDIQNTMIQSRKPRSDTFERWKYRTDCCCEYTSIEKITRVIAMKRNVAIVDSPSCNKKLGKYNERAVTHSRSFLLFS